jgi:hypothetical protein
MRRKGSVPHQDTELRRQRRGGVEARKSEGPMRVGREKQEEEDQDSGKNRICNSVIMA